MSSCNILFRRNITKCLCCENDNDSFEIYMINFYIARDKFKIDINKYLRKLITCPRRKYTEIPGYDDSVIKTKFDTFPARSSVNVDTSTEKNVQDLKEANG